MELKGKGADFNLKTDIGVGKEDVSLVDNEVIVTLHNLSGCDAPPCVVAIVDKEGNVLSQNTSKPISAPNDLLPKATNVKLPIPNVQSLSGCRIVIDPQNEVDEIYEGNNEVLL